MPKKKEQPEEQSGELAILQAKHDALADEVLTLRELVELYKQENQDLEAQMDKLRTVTTSVASSISIAPPAAKSPECPTVDIDGQQYCFKVGEVRFGRVVVRAADLAADETRLREVFAKYPGIFKKL